MSDKLYHQDNRLKEIWLSFEKSIQSTDSIHAYDQCKAEYLGSKSQLRAELKALGSLDPKLRAQRANSLNALRKDMEVLAVSVKETLKQRLIQQRIESERVDDTLPSNVFLPGSLHPFSHVQKRLNVILSDMGYVLTDGPECETAYYNFTALNTPADHPATTTQDTLYINRLGRLLRSHTSSVQIRVMQAHKPPLRIFAPGRVFRADTPDATHSPCFHQCEGLVIEPNASMTDLVQALSYLLEQFFSESLKLRFRPSYFPFTEPSLECDIWFKGRWIEVLGCGMVHPNVLQESSIDAKKYSGYAFGVGIDRLSMLYYGIDTLKPFYEGDLEFLRQFSADEVI